MMIYVYVDGVAAPLTAYLQVVAESLLDVVHSLMCPCAGIRQSDYASRGSLKASILAQRAQPVAATRRCS
jgi:hypothetical protein